MVILIFYIREDDMSQEFEKHKKSFFLKWLENNDAFASLMDNKQEYFDMYACDVNDFAWLKSFVPDLIIHSAGGMFPFQAEGYLGDMSFYFRTEDNYASLTVSNSRDTVFSCSEALYTSRIELTDFSSSDTLEKDWVSYLLTSIDRLERNPLLYFFETNKIDFDTKKGQFGLDIARDGKGNILTEETAGWGFSVNEAFSNLSGIDYYRSLYCVNHYDDMKNSFPEMWERANSKLWSEEKLQHYFKLLDIRPQVTRVEGLDRKYPDTDPDFTVNVPEIWRKDSGIIQLPL